MELNTIDTQEELIPFIVSNSFGMPRKSNCFVFLLKMITLSDDDARIILEILCIGLSCIFEEKAIYK